MRRDYLLRAKVPEKSDSIYQQIDGETELFFYWDHRNKKEIFKNYGALQFSSVIFWQSFRASIQLMVGACRNNFQFFPRLSHDLYEIIHIGETFKQFKQWKYWAARWNRVPQINLETIHIKKTMGLSSLESRIVQGCPSCEQELFQRKALLDRFKSATLVNQLSVKFEKILDSLHALVKSVRNSFSVGWSVQMACWRSLFLSLLSKNRIFRSTK